MSFTSPSIPFWLMIGLAIVSTAAAFGIPDEGTRLTTGCHRVGHSRRVTIPDCVSFQLTTNACRGHCESWSVPTTVEALFKNPGKRVTSVGQCCNMMTAEDVTVRVMCLGGPRDFTFKSAKSCSCFHCKKD